MSAEIIARALGGRRAGKGWIARCPAHDDRVPSLSLSDGRGGKVLLHCHAGCGGEQVIAVLRERGLWGPGPGRVHRQRRDHQDGQSSRIPDHDEAKRQNFAMEIWRVGAPAAGSLVETYLQSRRLVLPKTPALRFHPRLKHPSGSWWPAMMALVTRGKDGAPVAIHRTFLDRNGLAKAPVDPAKMMLGPCRGGAVTLAPASELLMVGEGIETCLAAMAATGDPAWAALSTSGLRTLELPATVRRVIVLADGDDAGEAAAQACALRWTRQGRSVRIARPPRGLDFNDLALGQPVAMEESPHD